MMVPSEPTGWVPRRVPAVVGVPLTLRLPIMTWTLSPVMNLVEGGGVVTVTVVDCVAVPPVPVQARV